VPRLAVELPDGPVPPELDAVRRAPAPVYVSFFGVSQVLAFLYLMTNKPGLGGSVAACAVAALASVVVAAVRVRSIGGVGAQTVRRAADEESRT
jgi:hypothetical protein